MLHAGLQLTTATHNLPQTVNERTEYGVVVYLLRSRVATHRQRGQSAGQDRG